MTRWKLALGGGLMALALMVTGLTANRVVDAQDATPSTGNESAETETVDQTTAYDEFVGGLAANLGIVDATTVDTAIKETLKQMVDQKFADGEISANAATAMKERIDAGEFSLGLGRIGGFGPGDGHRGPDGRGDDKDGTTTAPDATPSAETATTA
jgi:hypothetical protein